MSPIGGVGINLAIQDAVASANILARPLRERTLTTYDLRAVQRRRLWPTKVVQAAQVFVQDRILTPTLERGTSPTAPWPVKLLRDFPILRRLPARAVGLGIRPEHVRTPPMV
jgi:2-polyprenyl-6-methoxyphenol hydroxylase-like FAD-dependent oxidoreductase